MKTSNSSININSLHGRVKELGKKEVVLDVRSREEYMDGHVPGSINIPRDEVARYAAKLKSYDRIYVHCQAGKRAQLAFADLEKQGLTNLVCVTGGGMADWIEAGYEIDKGA
ncbi:MAG: rhodanese-like domain-containing protein [Bdellovibrionota bacterium]